MNLPPQLINCKIKCPFCGDELDSSELRENFEFKEVPSVNTCGWLCCNFCEAPIEELEELEEFCY
ncbi:hypothetical protein [Nostoc sp. UHCC 0251]|uniref:hypothetical protein n=1 Tax=Nostoc sp. UHCC 0251 TaxID=3110240 RepID=UPI002B1F316C|nr:hypothetical protein [Nostoc sp. UHCC 0251]MEA5623534.1 hypothetical protein [Nostoc sp. UHCC 0251]